MSSSLTAVLTDIPIPTCTPKKKAQKPWRTADVIAAENTLKQKNWHEKKEKKMNEELEKEVKKQLRSEK
ncbi:hypothetical protein HK096_008515 [Nowakowskiella sp. JEL0078]|nr:hypothetical protein HK096_008515 [Nowakowskiella sp. JEL0078]